MSDAASPPDARTFSSASEWAAWLDAAHDTEPGIWLQLAKKTSDVTSVTYDDALQIALCYGWIDGQKKPLDETWWLQRFTPRRRGSRWSQRNVRIVTELVAAGRMMPPGQAEIDEAKADGRWEAAYAGARTMALPDDLVAALAADPIAASNFEGLDGANRYAILYRLHDAKRPETRARRLTTFVEMLHDGRTLHPRRNA